MSIESELLTRIQELEIELQNVKKQKRYGLVWEDKIEDVVERCKTELPVLEEDISRRITETDDDLTHILIEGDNYHALSVLAYTHEKKVDVIYIDPPYNTGDKDFRYNDTYVDKEDSFRHSKWLSFMSKRLEIAKTLLKDTGVIFVSIDYHEYSQLKLLFDQIFGEVNFLNDLIWKKKKGGGNDSVHIANEHEYVLFYAKDKAKLGALFQNYSEKYLHRYKESDPIGKFFWDTYKRKSGKQYYPVTCPDGTVLQFDEYGNQLSWLRSETRFKKDLKDGEVRIMKIGDRWSVQFKQRLPEGKKPRSIIDEYGTTSSGNDELFGLFESHIFSNPKPSTLIKYLLQITSKDDSLILDFFAGSGTTGHAVLELNREDGGKRQCILVTNNENKIAEEVTYPRMRNVIAGYADVAGITANLRYYRTDFIAVEKSIDDLRGKFMGRCTEMLCIRENCFSEPSTPNSSRGESKRSEYFQVFENMTESLVIMYDPYDDIDCLSRYAEETMRPIVVYIFSMSPEIWEEEIASIRADIRIETIPDEILETYKKIFGF